MVAFAGRARFTGVNSGGGERMGDEVCGVEHPDTKRAGELRGRDFSGAEPPGLPPRGRRSHVSQTVVCDMVARLRPRLEDRRLPVAGPAARRLRASTTRPTSTTTSFPASATTGRDSTAACAPARLGRNLAHLVNTVATWSRTWSRSAMRGRTCSSGGGHLMEDWGAYLPGNADSVHARIQTGRPHVLRYSSTRSGPPDLMGLGRAVLQLTGSTSR